MQEPELPGDDGASGGEAPRCLGVLGTLVWDTIRARGGRRQPVEEWGGIAYALAGAAAALPPGWEVAPLVKVGRDLGEEGLRFLRRIPGVRCRDGVRVVPEPNNRVELLYQDRERRSERLSGGVPPWEWSELAPALAPCDALYVNFISGFEMELETARALRDGFRGPIYADLHSLFLSVGSRGLRVPRELPAQGEWLRCFDAVQMNEAEFDLLGRSWGDPWRLAADAVGPELKLICVTLGSRGAAYVAGAGFSSDPADWPGARERVAVPAPARSGKVDLDGAPVDGDPTGSGDVWGATFFARLLAGDGLEEAMSEANRLAARNVAHMGARGLHHHLSGRLAPGEESP